MRWPLFLPMKSPAPSDSTKAFVSGLNPHAFVLKGDGDVMGLINEMVNGQYPGLLQTIGLDGFPKARWMSTLSAEEFPLFYTLTSPESGKVKEIEANPRVTWMFFNQDLSLVIQMSGRARILRDTPTLKRIWRQAEDKSHAYFLKMYSPGLGFVVIETKIELVECSSPKNLLRFAVDLKEIRRRN
jgi:general stress protein 26